MTAAGVKRVLRRALPDWASVAVRRHVLRRPPVLPYLEVHVTDHCNLNCAGCGHFSPLSRPRFADPAVFARDLERLAAIASLDRLHLLGGEPLLHPDLGEFLRIARAALPDTTLNLVTNGVLVPRMPETFWAQLADLDVGLLVTAYPVPLDLTAIAATAEAAGVRLDLSESRTEFYKIPLRSEGDGDPRKSFARCRKVTNCPFLEDGRVYTCSYIPLSHLFAERFGWDLPLSASDSIDIHDPSVDGYRIAEYLARAVPFCRFCDLEHVTTFPWERSRFSEDEWTATGS